MKAPKSLQEVWEMKRLAFEATKHLRGADYFASIHREVRELLPPGMKLRTVTGPARRPIPAAKVAETPTKYRAKQKK